MVGTEQAQAEHLAAQAAIAAAARGVTLRSVTKQYGAVTAVENINLDIAAGSYCCLLGPSGCGKTTTLRMIAGHEEISGGEVFIGDQRVNGLPAAQRNTAMVFQNYALFPHKTVWKNVEFGLKMRNIPAQERVERVDEMLDIVGLAQFASRRPHMLSGGQQQRVALARALVTRPQVLLLDEPLSALDESLRVKTRGELRKLQKQFGMTFIQVTHAQDEAFSLSDQIVVMDHGHIDQIGTPSAIFEEPASRFVAQFVGDNNLFDGRILQGADQNLMAQIEVDGLGVFVGKGSSASVGMAATCCVRSDRLLLTPTDGTLPADYLNQVMARITSIEFTGYITRVSLMVEQTETEILYKARTTDWQTLALDEGEQVRLSWMPEHCSILLS
ncbi:ABC transporter ATP-binding protein [Leptolyngbya sp. CCY15150]|uniref:ABC transporter ATP-binding protein n=1 Tax=Leptolyngbya sp. CCY15150 TaxID=2767772 RepID=UPI00195050DD|nr:ABC transporter ATP-binding protein [Leptolyngbya sp. CCY15150]